MVSFARVVEKGATPAGLLGALRGLWKTPGPAGGRTFRPGRRQPRPGRLRPPGLGGCSRARAEDPPRGRAASFHRAGRQTGSSRERRPGPTWRNGRARRPSGLPHPLPGPCRSSPPPRRLDRPALLHPFRGHGQVLARVPEGSPPAGGRDPPHPERIRPRRPENPPSPDVRPAAAAGGPFPAARRGGRIGDRPEPAGDRRAGAPPGRDALPEGGRSRGVDKVRGRFHPARERVPSPARRGLFPAGRTPSRRGPHDPAPAPAGGRMGPGPHPEGEPRGPGNLDGLPLQLLGSQARPAGGTGSGAFRPGPGGDVPPFPLGKSLGSPPGGHARTAGRPRGATLGNGDGRPARRLPPPGGRPPPGPPRPPPEGTGPAAGRPAGGSRPGDGPRPGGPAPGIFHGPWMSGA